MSIFSSTEAYVRMQAFTSPAAMCDDENRALQYLLDVFGSTVSLQDIASAYCQAKYNLEMACDLLCTSHASSSDGASSSKVQFEGASLTSSQGLESEGNAASAVPAGMSSDKALHEVGSTIASKSKKQSISAGTVSNLIGKEYIRPRSSTNESIEMKKPLKLRLEDLPVSKLWSEEVESTLPEENSKMHADIEEFLFKMLREGFNLDMSVIREVLGLCGYGVQKSMEKLLFMSASTLEKSDDVVGLSSVKSIGKCSDQHYAHSDGSRYSIESPIEEKDGVVLQKEVLEALFHAPERSEEPRRLAPSREVKRYKAFKKKKIVVQPFTETLVECKTTTVAAEEVTRTEDEDDENSYEALRKSVKEYWTTMKEYYEAAFEAFCEDDYVRSDKLLEKGHFLNKKAREADEKSAQKIIEVRSREDVVSLDLQHHEPKEAIRLLRLQLTYLSGLPDLKYLMVIVVANDEDTTGGARWRLIIKQLEKEAIKWTEEENGRSILIRLDVIDPKRLSFFKKITERNKSSP